MNAAYFQAAIPEPYRILGLQLRPLSLGRYRLMKRHSVAFVSDEPEKTGVQDLILGVLICSQRVDDFQAWLELPAKRRFKDVRKWSKKVCPSRRKAPDLIQKMQLFRAYIDEHQRIPKYWDESGDERTSAAHWSHSVEVCLRSQLGWSRDEINEEPLSKALADYFKFAESQGAIRMMTDEEARQGEENARVFEQLMRN